MKFEDPERSPADLVAVERVVGADVVLLAADAAGNFPATVVCPGPGDVVVPDDAVAAFGEKYDPVPEEVNIVDAVAADPDGRGVAGGDESTC